MSDSAESVKVVNMGNDSPPSTQKSNGQIIRKWGGGVQSGPKNPGGLDLDTIKPVEDSDKKEEKEKEPEPEPKPEKVVDDNDSEEEIDSSSDDGDIEENNNDEKPVKTEETEKRRGGYKRKRHRYVVRSIYDGVIVRRSVIPRVIGDAYERKRQQRRRRVRKNSRRSQKADTITDEEVISLLLFASTVRFFASTFLT